MGAVAARLAASGVVLASGFRSLSDDDWARIAIAQRFAEAPAMDPSGTSWLPLPFWLLGGAMRALGATVEVAQGVALGSGVAATLLVLAAGRALGLPWGRAALAAAVASLFPYSARLGVAAVPEALTAGCMVAGAAAATRLEARVRLAGGAALLVATLSRYEAWPVAAGFAAFAALDAARHRSPALWLAGAAAAAGPIAWLAHGVAAHGDALFFVARVAEYRRAVGGGGAGSVARLLGYPIALARCEPELAVAAACTVAAWGAVLLGQRWERLTPPPGVAAGTGGGSPSRHRFGGLLALVLAFLVVGELRDGAPTHHAERVLLPLWFAVALLVGGALPRAAASLRPGGRAALASALVLGLPVAAGVLRPWFARTDDFVDRTEELALGRTARALAAPEERLAIVTRDFAYFAVTAGFGAPSRVDILDDRDPRRAAGSPIWASAGALEAALGARPAAWLVVPAESEAARAPLGAVARAGARHTLLRTGARLAPTPARP
ncbi:MAG: hypothetical protein IT376_09670 [Polyangiaceae bacterium]|nr:hypothetical protein [Polyangiaceae bacterium]